MAELSEKHSGMALLYSYGMSPADISKKYDISPQAASSILKRNDVEKELTRLRRVREKQASRRYELVLDKVFEEWEPIIKQIQSLAIKAESESVRRSACKDLTTIMQASAVGKDNTHKLPDIRMFMTKRDGTTD